MASFYLEGDMVDIRYYEELLDFLDVIVPCLDDLILQFDEQYFVEDEDE